jgi:hypothetical protein
MFGLLRDAEARRQDMVAFDELPASLRHLISSAPYGPSSVQILGLYHRLVLWSAVSPARATAMIAQAFREVTEENLQRFARDYAWQHGLPLPHAGAQASLLWEDPWRQPRRPRRGRRLIPGRMGLRS